MRGSEQASEKGSRRRHNRGRARPRPLVAAIDLGSNNCRLLIAQATKDGEFRVVDSFSRVVRLGEGVAQTGELAPAAIDRTIAALTICAQRIKKSGARRVRAIVTQAARYARNAQVLVERARGEAGLVLEIVSAEEEARLAAIGCAPL